MITTNRLWTIALGVVFLILGLAAGEALRPSTLAAQCGGCNSMECWAGPDMDDPDWCQEDPFHAPTHCQFIVETCYNTNQCPPPEPC